MRQLLIRASLAINAGTGNLILPAGEVTIMIEYGNWSAGSDHVHHHFAQRRANPPSRWRKGWVSNEFDVRRYAGWGSQCSRQRAGDWRVWVGVQTRTITDDLSEVDVPASGCSTRDKWRQHEGVYQATFKCEEFTLRGAHYPA